MRYFLIVLIVFGYSASADRKAEDEKMDKAARKVKVYRKGEPPASCEEIEEITSPDISVIDKVGHEMILRRMAVQKGANALMVIGQGKHTLTATIYKCK